ncbi:hypothetical protein AMAG_12995 [Allomyces macrogynus ATCC 38327]|uniref:Actin-like ATPase domain-containing protein n=1 Tax=Allomyces macrogynus (strain ATCC 38327) TaxID=578462 RepID=A0A0L0T0Q8_ALLM3|nr:hypothetical protein AMAG_12995 [Allomyces macrogynus ATCC 38327]|eukprot:KNE68337.1 hypothetical protein AMAG_12995 [Allomyces macrogynus ATCC 38327]
MGQDLSRPVNVENAYPLRHQIAIDFGTSHSGFAISDRSFPDALNHDKSAADLAALQRIHLEHHIKFKTQWPGAADPYPKTHTALLYRCDNGELDTWGNQALKKYMDMPSDAQNQYIYIDRFKLFLDDSRKHTDPAMDKLKALGKSEVDVIADYLKVMAREIQAFLEHLNPSEYVPAMWSDAANHKMRQAMFKAGLIYSPDSDRLDFCSEPMAGLLYEMLSTQSSKLIKKDDAVLIVDMGGGTELVPGLGASCGSTMLDVAFLKMFRDAIGAKKYDEIVEQCPQIKAKIRGSWEMCKVKFFGNDPNFHSPVTVPRPLLKACPYDDGKPVPGTGGATFEDGEFFLTHETARMLYQDIIDQIYQLVVRMLSACTSKGIQIAHILCVGGFSQSKFLVNELRKRLQNEKAKLVVTTNGASAILLGAPIFVCRPELLLNRVARITYGIETRTVYSETLHGPRHRLGKRLVKSVDGVDRVNKAFGVIIRRGDTLVPGPIAKKTFLPSTCSQTEATFPIYVSAQEDPLYTDVGDCKKVGTFEVEVTPCNNPADRDSVTVDVTMRPSGFVFHAVSKRTNKPAHCQIDFYE